MMYKAKVLIVEDEGILYERLRNALSLEHFEIAEYCPSYEIAINQISIFQPDVVLLDIKLKGEKTGIDVGAYLNNKIKIPFIYLTEFDDDHTFYSSLNTNHSHFLVKTKPILNIKEVIRAIKTVLKNSDFLKKNFTQDGILCLKDYLENIKNFGSNQISRVAISFKNILYFSNQLNYLANKGEPEKIKTNYVGVKLNNKNDIFLLRCSLFQLEALLPYYFVRINNNCIVNLRSKHLKGKINSSRIVIGEDTICISKNYKESLEKSLRTIYLNF